MNLDRGYVRRLKEKIREAVIPADAKKLISGLEDADGYALLLIKETLQHGGAKILTRNPLTAQLPRDLLDELEFAGLANALQEAVKAELKKEAFSERGQEELTAALELARRRQKAATEKSLLRHAHQCLECHRYFINLSGREKRVYCSKKCGGNSTARITMRKRYRREHAPALAAKARAKKAALRQLMRKGQELLVEHKRKRAALLEALRSDGPGLYCRNCETVPKIPPGTPAGVCPICNRVSLVSLTKRGQE